MEVFYHNIYELQKGLRNLALCTEKVENTNIIAQRLKKENIDFVIHNIGQGKINVYFGKEYCIQVISLFNEVNLNKLSPEQDFILGIMLGYDRLTQTKRYLVMQKKNKQNKKEIA